MSSQLALNTMSLLIVLTRSKPQNANKRTGLPIKRGALWAHC